VDRVGCREATSPQYGTNTKPERCRWWVGTSRRGSGQRFKVRL